MLFLGFRPLPEISFVFVTSRNSGASWPTSPSCRGYCANKATPRSRRHSHGAQWVDFRIRSTLNVWARYLPPDPRMSATSATLQQRQLGGAGKAVDDAVADLFNRSAKIVNGRKGAAHMRCQFLAASSITEDRRKGCWRPPGEPYNLTYSRRQSAAYGPLHLTRTRGSLRGLKHHIYCTPS
jgi:hypothetical protein